MPGYDYEHTPDTWVCVYLLAHTNLPWHVLVRTCLLALCVALSRLPIRYTSSISTFDDGYLYVYTRCTSIARVATVKRALPVARSYPAATHGCWVALYLFLDKLRFPSQVPFGLSLVLLELLHSLFFYMCLGECCLSVSFTHGTMPVCIACVGTARFAAFLWRANGLKLTWIILNLC